MCSQLLRQRAHDDLVCSRFVEDSTYWMIDASVESECLGQNPNQRNKTTQVMNVSDASAAVFALQGWELENTELEISSVESLPNQY